MLTMETLNVKCINKCSYKFTDVEISWYCITTSFTYKFVFNGMWRPVDESNMVRLSIELVTFTPFQRAPMSLLVTHRSAVSYLA